MTTADNKDLQRHLQRLRIENCQCSYEWRGIGSLYGIRLGHGWIRINTNPDCPHHNDGGAV